jgi:hypothetical protein
VHTASASDDSLGFIWTKYMRREYSREHQEIQLRELERSRQEHCDLDAAILALEQVGTPDKLQIQRLKKRKLLIKDRISELSDQLTPDIIA